MALLAGDIQAGDEVIIPDFNFLSSSSIVLNLGGVPVFADINEDNLCIDEDSFIANVTKRTRFAIITTYNASLHKLKNIVSLCKKNNIVIIVDNAHSIGAKFENKYLSDFGDFSVFSFHETKNIQCGEGGALLVNNPNFYENVQELYFKGSNRSKFENGLVKNYEWVGKGGSYGMSEILASVLLPQVEKLEMINKKRREIVDSYCEKLLYLWEEYGIKITSPTSDKALNGHIFYILLRDESERDKLKQHLSGNGVIALPHYYPLHNSIGGKKYSRQYSKINTSMEISKKILRLPLFYSLSESNVKYISSHIKKYNFK
jgi:dTDP-4-amino-4,6-dideoxygalactose transaminase